MKNKCVKNPHIAMHTCKSMADSIREPILRKVALQVFDENEELFLTIKGSDFQHHNYAGGLVVHTANVVLNAIRLAEPYRLMVNIDLIKFCALMHDVGKVFDYEPQDDYGVCNDIKMNESLLGHSFEGAFYIASKLWDAYHSDNVVVSEEYAKGVITQVCHCIGAHSTDFGSCAEQQMFEVIILNCADMIDAVLDQTVIEDNGDNVILGLGRKFYKSVVDASKVKIINSDS